MEVFELISFIFRELSQYLFLFAAWVFMSIGLFKQNMLWVKIGHLINVLALCILSILTNDTFVWSVFIMLLFLTFFDADVKISINRTFLPSFKPKNNHSVSTKEET